MIVKATVYFNLVTDKDAKISDVPLLVESINKQLEDHLTGSSFKLAGSYWTDSRIKAIPVNREKALELLRTKS